MNSFVLKPVVKIHVMKVLWLMYETILTTGFGCLLVQQRDVEVLMFWV
jgi:hypothetical protein